MPPYPLKNARHHWAVRMLPNGAPIQVVQAQPGHSAAKLTLDTYGVFIPRAEDRARAEVQVTRAEPGAILGAVEAGAEQGSDVSAGVATGAG